MMMRRRIPKNVMKGKRIVGFKPANLKEAVIEIIILVFIMFQIPFVTKIRWILIICVGAFIVLVNYIGFAGFSIFQTLYYYLLYRKEMKSISYRRLSHGCKAKDYFPVVVNGKVQSIKKHRKNEAIKNFLGQN